MLLHLTHLLVVSILHVLIANAVAAGSSTPVVDVAIIGGGPAGLATALSLRRALGSKANIQIFERAKTMKDVGAHVGLLPLCFDALDAIDPTGTLTSKVEKAGDCRTLLRRYNGEGILEEDIPSDPQNKEERVVVVPWHRLQEVLVGELRQQEHGDSMLRLGCELVAMDMNDKPDDGKSGVVLSFSNGETCRAKIVIGADGNMSRVRSLLCGGDNNDENPVYAGSVIWRMGLSSGEIGQNILKKISDTTTSTGVSNVWANNGRVLVAQKFGSGDSAKTYISGQAAWPEDRLHMLDRQYCGNTGYNNVEKEDVVDGGGRKENRQPQTSALDRFLEEFQDFPRDIMDVVAKECKVGSLLEHPIYFRPPGRPWGKSHATLLGDAAHGMPPNSAMGVPMALEDAVALGHACFQYGCTDEALRAYEKARQTRVNTIANAVISQSTGYYKDRDEDSNPFKVKGNEGIVSFVRNFQNKPVPQYGGNHASTQIRKKS
ncbi:FAD binding domain [Seminavis robusta]|uniref:FAD binding domain n=1 Tax=Seminavis robusta TaxID=568900 RepID=A0A9N8DR10_9STRA|nr:FAD binding domain [Seminavis robusta]|eukprot:Sro309_g113830.1 FAD binding domain (489) ;mRNA; f:44792-46258